MKIQNLTNYLNESINTFMLTPTDINAMMPDPLCKIKDYFVFDVIYLNDSVNKFLFINAAMTDFEVYDYFRYSSDIFLDTFRGMVSISYSGGKNTLINNKTVIKIDNTIVNKDHKIKITKDTLFSITLNNKEFSKKFNELVKDFCDFIEAKGYKTIGDLAEKLINYKTKIVLPSTIEKPDNTSVNKPIINKDVIDITKISKLLFEDKLDESKLKCNKAEFITKLYGVCKKLKINPNWLMALMYIESKIDPGKAYTTYENGKEVANYNVAIGLIQFTKMAADDLNTTLGQIRNMNALQQLDLIYDFYKNKTYNNFYDLAVRNFRPNALNKSNDFVMFSKNTNKGIYNAHKVFDVDNKEYITVQDYKTHLDKRLTDTSSTAISLLNQTPEGYLLT